MKFNALGESEPPVGKIKKNKDVVMKTGKESCNNKEKKKKRLTNRSIMSISGAVPNVLRRVIPTKKPERSDIIQ